MKVSSNKMADSEADGSRKKQKVVAISDDEAVAKFASLIRYRGIVKHRLAHPVPWRLIVKHPRVGPVLRVGYLSHLRAH